MGLEETGRQLDEAVASLMQAGFGLVDDRVGDSFDNRDIDLASGALSVSVQRERGHISLAICSSAYGKFDLELWEACLDDRPPAVEVRPLQAQVQALVDRAADIQAQMASADPTALLECLRAAGRWRFDERRRLGLIGSPYQTSD